MLRDPIAALATAPGRSALAVVRLAGEGAFEVAARVIASFAAEPARTARLAEFSNSDGSPLDRGLYLTYAAPHSYSGDDTVELFTHGGLVVPARVLAALHAAGARPAAPGEFTRRAVLNGKLDLLQAEAVGDLVDATAGAQARGALHQLEGGLSRRIAALRERLIQLQALLSYDVDFPEEDDGPVPRERIRAELASVRSGVGRLIATAPAGERLREGALVVFAGRPNVGKSSLFNALLGRERALVTPEAGTTRDTIEAFAEFDGWPVRLADTAGLWDAPGTLDRLGVEVSRKYLGGADLVLLCVEAGRELGSDEAAILGERPCLLVRTKADLARPGSPEGLPVSVVTGAGLDALRRQAAEHLFAGGRAYADLEPLLTRERHRVALARAAAALADAAPELGATGDAALAAHHVHQATLALEELIGVVGVEEVLDRVFAAFCVGK